MPRSPSPKKSVKLIVVIHKGILSAHASDEMEETSLFAIFCLECVGLSFD